MFAFLYICDVLIQDIYIHISYPYFYTLFILKKKLCITNRYVKRILNLADYLYLNEIVFKGYICYEKKFTLTVTNIAL